MKIDITLSKSSVDNAIKQIERYRDSLERKCKEIENRLAEDCAIIANNSISSEYAGYIDVDVKNGIAKDGSPCKEVVARNVSMMKVYWVKKGSEKGGEADVNPILMSEFGSGWFANSFKLDGEEIGGQGTFPGQQHANQEGGWYYKKEIKGETYHSFGTEPDAPMEKAFITAYANAENTVKGVFRNGNI